MTLSGFVSTLASRVPSFGDALSVLCYHQVADEGAAARGRFTVTTAALAEHLNAIERAGLPIVPMATLETQQGPAVALSFDDNSPSHLTAAGLLNERGLPAVFFLNPGHLGEKGGLGRSHVEALLELGMGVGAHGFRHERIVDVAEAALVSELVACRDFLLQHDQPLLWAYPGGDLGSFTAEQDRIVHQAGFAVRLTTQEGRYRPGVPEQPRSRYVIRADSSIRYVTAAAAGGLQLIAALKKARHAGRRATGRL